MPDISILIPAIRQNRWPALYDSLSKACKKFKWEVVFISPFDLPLELQDKDNITLVKDYGSVSRAIQIGVLACKAPIFFSTVDDCVFMEDSIDISMRQYLELNNTKNILSMRYKESQDILEANYYYAKHHEALRISGINQEWLIAPQFIINVGYFINLGGFNCQLFEYSNEACHDMVFRAQRNGSNVVPSIVHSCVATHYPGISGDHKTINDAQLFHDYPAFVELYRRPPEERPINIDYDNWKETPAVWSRRFTQGISDSYQELVEKEGYHV